MTEDTHAGSLRAPRGTGSAGEPGKLYRTGRRLVGLALLADGLNCAIRPWVFDGSRPSLAFLVYLGAAGLAMIAAATGIAGGKAARGWALALGACALLLTIPAGETIFPRLDGLHFFLATLAMAAAVWMLAGVERLKEAETARWLGARRAVFAGTALACIVARALLNAWMQSGFDMFYYNYDAATLFNSFWAWNSFLTAAMGALATIGAVAIFWRRLTRIGAICLAAASILFLPLLVLYRLDDFCGSWQVLVELTPVWALDLGLAGGALVAAAATGWARDGKDKQGAATKSIVRRPWVPRTMTAAAVVLLAVIAVHGLIPWFFYAANSRGNARLGDLAGRIYIAAYVPQRGNSYWGEKMTEDIRSAGPAGRACAAGDARGCQRFGDFYFWLGWNWGRAWRFHAKANALAGAREQER